MERFRSISRYSPDGMMLQLVPMPGAFLCSVCDQRRRLRPKFLGKQLALYEERYIQPRRATNAARLVMVWLSALV